MLDKNNLLEIKNFLERSQNPVFFFDNDVDGLCAFLILRRAIDRGKGVIVKSFPDLKEQYLRKVDELKPDAVFVIDKAEISKSFVEGVVSRNLPLILIDHHKPNINEDVVKNVHYYNSYPSAEPSTYIAYKVFENKKDLWLAMIGCIGDVYYPEFAEDFEKQNPELYNSKIPIFDSLYKTDIGKIARMLNFGLMDTTSNVVLLIKYLFKAKGPYDLLEENKHTKRLHKRYNELNNYLSKQVERAKKSSNFKNVIFYSYSGDISMSSEIANKIYFENPDKLVVVAFMRQDKVNVSIRGKNALCITKKAIESIPGATGGGHSEATGAMIPIDYFDEFKKNIFKLANL